jgi:hypothetical protein
MWTLKLRALMPDEGGPDRVPGSLKKKDKKMPSFIKQKMTSSSTCFVL